MARPLVSVKQGWLRGAEIRNNVGGSFISFKGVPFAEPPVAELRFKDPQPKQPWDGVREAVNEESQCLQLDELSNKIEGSEDCLYLNVATNSLEGSRAVMVWIHGGAFIWGDGGSDIYGPDYLVKTDVVFVSINYRLGVFGFLQLDDPAATGNMGMKDQVAGLEWVKENIAKFGGDPNNVTIFGESAGAASVHYHLLSPLSKGLFHKAIVQSGVAFNPWARVRNPLEIAQRLLSRLGKKLTDPNEIVEYLRAVPAEKLCEAQLHTLTPEEKMLIVLPFGPTIDGKSSKPFLPYSPYELAAEAERVPIIIGYNSHEGIMAVSGLTDEEYLALDRRFETTVVPGLLGIPRSESIAPSKRLRKFYLRDGKISKDQIEGYIRCIGDAVFNVGIHELVDIRAKSEEAPTYLYRFSYNAPKKLSTSVWNFDCKGSGHMDEISHLFYPTRLHASDFVRPGSIDEVISKRFVKMWTNFAKFGNPTPELDGLITVKWHPVSPTSKNYLDIRSELSAGVNPDEEMCRFWKSLR